jgi:hypothetical protein
MAIQSRLHLQFPQRDSAPGSNTILKTVTSDVPDLILLLL